MENKIYSIPEHFGCKVFNDNVMKERLPEDVYASLKSTIENRTELDSSVANIVANAMKDWAIDLGATHYTHWFQPLTGVTAEKHDSFMTPTSPSTALVEFSGKELIKGEPDASSFPSGGLRATFEARGYTAWDASSFAFVKEGTLYIPTVFCSYTGEALDNKTPLLRSMEAISREAMRILKLFGDDKTTCVNTSVGAEQEYFLVDEKDYNLRSDLLYTGRTLFGSSAPKGQQLDDHYFGPLKLRVSEFMADLDKELWELGIPAKTKHNEVAPAQHELAPVYGSCNLAIDQNLLTMETMKRVARKHGMVCLLHEKPFEGINGSGKHNNWSISTNTGKNLLKPGKTPADNTQFLLFLAAIIRAVDEYQDLVRLSVASASNDHRLGADEAPPAIVSIFLGDDLFSLIQDIISKKVHINKEKAIIDFHAPTTPNISQDTTDRNRTSPFAFTGNKFEFRMCGSSQNLSMANIVLNTAVADSLKIFADQLEKETDFDLAVGNLIRKTFTKYKRILFNGNGYSEAWKEEAAKRGLSNYATAVDVYPRLTEKKNVKLFTSMDVMSSSELHSRKEILFENYEKVIRIEAATMVDMAIKDYLPSINSYIQELCTSYESKEEVLGFAPKMDKELIQTLTKLNDQAYEEVKCLKTTMETSDAITNMEEKAIAYKNNVLPCMNQLRKSIDEMENLTARDFWPVPTYGQLTFSVK